MLESISIDGNFINILKALYHKVKCSVKFNGVTADWLDVPMRDAFCHLSSLIFSLKTYFFFLFVLF